MGTGQGMRHTGFTLLEVLVAVTVFSFLVTAVYSSLSLGVRSWEANARESDELEEIRITQRFLRNYLGSAIPVLVSESDEVRPYFHGGEQALHFVTDMPSHLGYGGLYQMWLGLREAGERRPLVVTRRLLHSSLIAEPGPGVEDESVLANDVNSLSIAYYGQTQGEETPQWHEVWEEQTSLPALVRIRVASEANGEWPELLVRLTGGASRRITGGDWIAGPVADGMFGGP